MHYWRERVTFSSREVEEEHEQNQLPRVFERARDHFSRFTLHNYGLCLEKGEASPRLAAIELRNGKRRELDELSDGTRAQLLLAARIAYTEEVEQGKVMPLFLDEALDQSDPQRFQAITASLGRVARDQGRQIFYLTSDPLDVDRIRDALAREGCDIAAEIDLGRIRTDAVSVKGPQDLRIDPVPPVPEPGEVVTRGIRRRSKGAGIPTGSRICRAARLLHPVGRSAPSCATS